MLYWSFASPERLKTTVLAFTLSFRQGERQVYSDLELAFSFLNADVDGKDELSAEAKHTAKNKINFVRTSSLL